MENLHVELKLDIFSRLPAESILDCKLVCKPWLRLLKNDPLFPQMHLRRQLLMQQQQLHHDDQLDFIYLKYVEVNQRSCNQLWYGKYGGKHDDDDDVEHSFRGLKRINHPTITVGHLRWQHWNVFIGSCNGLICYSITHHGIEDPISICNPVTREFVYLPRFIISDEIDSSKYHRMVGGFGYNPSSNEYKVVRIFYPYRRYQEPNLGRVQVYTLGDGNGWRDKGEITYSICYGRRGVLVNGEIHWLVNHWKIVAFNLALEEFHLIASPPIIVDNGGYDCRRLSVLGRWLCLSHYLKIGRVYHVDMWLLKKKTSSIDIDDMNEQVEYHRGGWIKELTIKTDYPINPLGLTNRGEILLMKSRFLCIYDLKTATIGELEELSVNYCSKTVIPHINSFVSLKALGEKGRRRKKSYA